jgi:hypothetical protein
VPRIFRFVDILGCELHKISDPDDKLPIPQTWQLVSIGSSRMRVESVKHSPTDSSEPTVYNVRVRSVSAT